MLLFLATLNSANLALAHQRARLGDLTLRQVLGAGRAAIVHMPLLDFLPILVIMSVIAVVLAVYCVDLLHAYQLPSPNMPFEIRFGRAAILYLVGTGLMVMLCVTASAVAVSVLARPSASGLHEVAQRGSASRTFRATQRVMAAVQMAIALILIICGVLLSQSLIVLLRQPPHFRRQHLVVKTVTLPKKTSIKESWWLCHTHLRDLPATRSVALCHMVPFGESLVGRLFYPTGDRSKRVWSWMPPIRAGFFATMGIHLVAGRPFGRMDEQPGSHAVIVSVALARAFFGRTNVVGETPDGDARIIGVAPNIPWTLDPDSDHHGFAVYIPIAVGGGHYVHVLNRSSAPLALLIRVLELAVDSSVIDSCNCSQIRQSDVRRLNCERCCG